LDLLDSVEYLTIFFMPLQVLWFSKVYLEVPWRGFQTLGGLSYRILSPAPLVTCLIFIFKWHFVGKASGHLSWLSKEEDRMRGPLTVDICAFTHEALSWQGFA
jgi:hypothetical protein